MVNFRLKHVVRNRSLGTGTSGLESVKLPKAHSISRLWARHRVTHASSIDVDHNKVEVVGDGGDAIVSNLPGSQLRQIQKYWTGRAATRTASAGATFDTHFMIQFGRTPRDTEVILPANLFELLDLQVDWDTNGVTPVTNRLDVMVEEILGLKPEGRVMKRLAQLESFTQAANQERDVEFPVGRSRSLANVYLDYADVDNIDGGPVQLGINNFEQTFVSLERAFIEELNLDTYRFNDDAIPTTMIVLDPDVRGDGVDAIPTDGLSDLKLRLTAAGSGTSGTARVIAEEYIPIRA